MQEFKKKNPNCTQQFYFECDSFFSILLRWFTEEVIGYGFAFVFFHKNFRQITMASYFYLVKATVQKQLSCINF